MNNFKLTTFFCIILIHLSLQAYATTCIWKGGNGGWRDSTKWACSRIPSMEDDVIIDSGYVKLDMDVHINSLKLSGLGRVVGNANLNIKTDLVLLWAVIENEGNVNVGGNLIWKYANFDGTGTVTINGNTKIVGTVLHYISKKTLILNGGGNWLEGDICICNGAVLHIPVGQTLKEEGDSKMIYNFNISTNDALIVEGNLLKSGNGDIDITNVMLKNKGSIDITQGSIRVEAPFSNTGTIKANGLYLTNFDNKDFGTSYFSDTASARIFLEEGKKRIQTTDFVGALPRLNKAYRILKQTGDTLNLLFAEVLLSQAACHSDGGYAMRKFDKAINLTDILIEKYLPFLGSNLELVARAYEIKGAALHIMLKSEEAIKVLPKAIALRKKLSGERAIINLILRLAQAYARKGDFEKSIFHYSQLLDIGERLKSDKVRLAVYGDMGILNKNLGNYEKSLFYHNKSIDIIEKVFSPNDFRLIVSFTNRGVTYKFLGRYDEAIADLERAYKLALTFWTEGTYHDFGYAYSNMADCYTLKGDDSKAIFCFEKAIRLLQNLKEEAVATANCHYGIAVIFLKKQNTKEVFEHLKQAAMLNNYTQKNHFESVLSLEDLVKVFVLYNQAYRLEYQRTGKQSYLDSAYQVAQMGISAINFFKKELAFSDGRSRLIKDNYPIYEAFLQTLKAFKQDSTDSQAFQVAEQCKSVQLYEAMKNTEILTFGQVPPQYLAQIKLFQAELSKYEKQKQQLVAHNTAETDSNYVATLTLQLEWQLKNDSLKAEIRSRHNNYYNLYYGEDVSNSKTLQTQVLKPNQTLVEYFVGDSSLFVFVIKPNFYKVIEIKKDFPLDEWVRLLRGSLNADSFRIQADIYTDMAYKLYEKLIKPIKPQLSEDVIIVPDGILGYIPFEALLTQKPEKAIRFHDHAYLLREHNISYSFSATLLREMMQKKHRTPPNKSVVAYAPFFDGDTTAFSKIFSDDLQMRQGFIPLSNSGEEAFRIAKIMGGEALTGKDVTENKFLETAPTARIIHLATHGKADDKSSDYSFLAFSPIKDSIENELLYVRDLYNMTLNADMVVLSACETGIGKLQRGEGIISLARAFAYAGAKSIITTLWAVNDTKTKDLMILFYKNLKKGKSKDAALREAKLSFIDKNTHPNAHPFFWAGFIGIGDMSPVR